MNVSCSHFRAVSSTNFLLPMLAACLAVLSGCQGEERLPIEGTVTINGEPLADGYLRMAGIQGPSAGAPVKDGEFHITADRGVLQGAFRVEVTSLRPSGRQVRDFESSEMVDELVQFIPPRYNTATELEVEITPSGPNHFEFDLQTP